MPGDFVTVECPDCGNEQTLYAKAASEVHCAVCGTRLATPTGGEAEIAGEVLEVVQDRPE